MQQSWRIVTEFIGLCYLVDSIRIASSELEGKYQQYIFCVSRYLLEKCCNHQKL